MATGKKNAPAPNRLRPVVSFLFSAVSPRLRVGRQTKGRRGKGVTVVTGVPLTGADLTKLAKALKKRCGSGGTVKDGVIEIQGDHRDALVAELTKQGFTVKRSGG